MTITYKTVITDAINGFNNIQAALAGFSDLNVNPVVNYGSQISGSLNPSELQNEIKKLATIHNGTSFIKTGHVDIYDGSID